MAAKVAGPGGGPARTLRALGTASWLVAQAARGLVLDILDADMLARARFAQALRRYAWTPLPVLLGLAALAGSVAGTVGARLLLLYDAPLLIVPPLLRALAHDIVPLLCGLFAAGRVSVELAARLAATWAVHEIDALEALGRDPVRHLLAPALAGVVLAVPVQVVGAALVAGLATGAALRLDGTVDWPTFLRLAGDMSIARALAMGMLKAWAFALIAFAVGATVGSRRARGAEAIGRGATTAFTGGLLGVFAAATLWTLLE